MEARQEDVMWLRVVAIKTVGFWIDFKGKAKRVSGKIRWDLGEKGSQNDSKVTRGVCLKSMLGE